MPDHTEGISFDCMGFTFSQASWQILSFLSSTCKQIWIPLGIKSQVRHLGQESCSEKEKGGGSKRCKAGNSFVFATVRWSQRYKWGDVLQLPDESPWGDSWRRAVEKVWDFSCCRSHRGKPKIIEKKDDVKKLGHARIWLQCWDSGRSSTEY